MVRLDAMDDLTRDAEAPRWRLEAQLSGLLHSPVTWLGYHSLGLESDRVTAAVRVQVEDVTGYEVTFAHLDALEIASDSFPRPAPLPEATGGGETAG